MEDQALINFIVRDGKEEAEKPRDRRNILESIMPKKPREDCISGTEKSAMSNTAFCDTIA